MTDPTTRLREIVEARRSSAAASLLYAETGTRALDVLTDPAFVEKVAMRIDFSAFVKTTDFDGTEDWLAPEEYRDRAIRRAKDVLSLLASAALGDD